MDRRYTAPLFLLSCYIFVDSLATALPRNRRQVSLCDRACTRELRPVRAQQGDMELLFPNKCTFDVESCISRTNRGLPIVLSSNQRNILYPSVGGSLSGQDTRGLSTSVSSNKHSIGNSALDTYQPSSGNSAVYTNQPSVGNSALYTNQPSSGNSAVYTNQPSSGNSAVYSNQPSIGNSVLYSSQPSPNIVNTALYTNRPSPTIGNSAVYSSYPSFFNTAGSSVGGQQDSRVLPLELFTNQQDFVYPSERSLGGQDSRALSSPESANQYSLTSPVKRSNGGGGGGLDTAVHFY